MITSKQLESSTKLSKAAQKRAAKAGRQAGQMPLTEHLPAPPQDPESPHTSEPEGSRVNPVQVTPETDEEGGPMSSALQPASYTNGDARGLPNGDAHARAPAHVDTLPRSRSPGFAPVLPPLPHTPHTPLVRKRKASVDLAPGDAPAPKESKIEVLGAGGVHLGGVPVSFSPALAFKPRSNAAIRTLWTLIMLGGFVCACRHDDRMTASLTWVVLLLMGHPYMIVLVFLCQTAVYSEVTALFNFTHKIADNGEAKQPKDPWSTTLNWYFFAITNYFLYGETIIFYFKVSV